MMDIRGTITRCGNESGMSTAVSRRLSRYNGRGEEMTVLHWQGASGCMHGTIGSRSEGTDDQKHSDEGDFASLTSVFEAAVEKVESVDRDAKR